MNEITKKQFEQYSKTAISRMIWDGEALSMSYTALQDTSVLIALRMTEPEGDNEEMYFLSKKDMARFTRVVELAGTWKTTVQTRLHSPPKGNTIDPIYPNIAEESE